MTSPPALKKQWDILETKNDNTPLPTDLAVDSNYVYVVFDTSSAILKFNHEGKRVDRIEVKKGDRWCDITSIDVDTSGNIFAWIENCPTIADEELIKINKDGKIIKEIPVDNIHLVSPDVAVDSKGNIYLADNALFQIQGEEKIIQIEKFGDLPDDVYHAYKIFVDEYDNVVIHVDDNNIKKFTNDFKLLKTWSVNNIEFYSPWSSFVIDRFDNLYFTSADIKSIMQFDPNNKLTAEFGQITRKVSNPTLTLPFGKQIDNPRQTFSEIVAMDIDKSGNIFVLRAVDIMVQKYSQTKTIEKDTSKDSAKNLKTIKNTNKKNTIPTTKAKSIDKKAPALDSTAVTFDNFSIVPPSGWKKSDFTPTGQGVSFLASPSMAFPSLYAVNRSPFVQELDQVIFSLQMDAGNCKIIKEGKTKMAGKDGYYVEYDCPDLHGIIYGVAKNGYLYEVGFVAPSNSYKSHLNDVKKSIESFRFIK